VVTLAMFREEADGKPFGKGGAGSRLPISDDLREREREVSALLALMIGVDR
jgi:hypothetical protein